MKRVLIISYYWPPSGGSGVQRWVKFSRYLPSEGWQPVVYTPENPELIARDETLGKEVPEEVEVIRRRIFEPYEAYRRLCGKGPATGGEVNPINAQKKSLGKKVSMWIRGNFFIPDPRCMWILPSVSFLKKYLKEHPVDVIVSSGPPHSMHLIARKLAKASRTPWIADFRDPWTKMFYFKHLRLTALSAWIHRRLEKKVLDDADLVVSVSPLVRKDFEAMTKTPVELVTNGYDESDFEGERPDDGFFNICHTGLFASDGNPETFWKLLAKKTASDSEFASKMRLRLVGKTDAEVIASIKSAGLGDKLVDLGYRPHEEAVREQRGASLLLLPLRREPEYRAVLPGKLFEYLAAGAPILGIGQNDGAMAQIVLDTDRGIVAGWEDEATMEDMLERSWSAFKDAGHIHTGKDISQYSRRSTAAKMASLMESVSTR